MAVRTSNTQFFTVLDPVPREGIGWTLEVYDRASPQTRLAVLPRWQALAFQVELDGLGNGTATLLADDPAVVNPLPGGSSATLLDRDHIWRIYDDGVLRFSFVASEVLSEDGAEGAERTVQVQGPGIGVWLEYATILPANFPNHTELNRIAVDRPIMSPWLDLFTEASLRNVYGLAELSPTFSHTTDTAGEAWTDTSSINIAPGGNLLALLERWAQVADASWRVSANGSLDVFLSGGLGAHLEDSVRFWLGGDVRELANARRRRELRSRVYLKGGDNSVAQVVDGDTEGDWGKRETWMDGGEAATATTSAAYAQAALRELGSEAQQRTLSVAQNSDESGRPRPFVDYNVGDWVGIGPKQGSLDGYRVQTITVGVEVGNARNPTIQLGLQSKLSFELERLQRRLQNLTGGATGSGSATASSGSLTVTYADLGNLALDDLTDVAVAGAPGGSVLRYSVMDGWVDDLLVLEDIADLDLSGAADGDQLTYDAVAGQWIPAPPGGTGSGFSWGDPITEQGATGTEVLADEFEDATFDPAWVRVEDAVRVNWREGRDVLSASYKSKVVGAANKPHALVRPLPGGLTAFTVEAATRRMTEYAVNYMMFGLVVSGGTSYTGSYLLWMMPYQDTSTAGARISVRHGANWSAGTDFGSLNWSGDWAPWLYQRLVWKGGTSWQFYVGVDGVGWLDLWGGAKTIAGLTPTHVGLGIGTWGNTRDGIASAEYLRVYDADLGDAPAGDYDTI